VSASSSTDYWAAEDLARLGPVGVVALQKLARRATDRELGIRRRRVEELQSRSYASHTRGGNVPEGKTSPASRSTVSGPSVDFRPDATPRFEVTLSSSARQAIETELCAAAPFDVETGGHLFSHERRALFADVVHASGPAPSSEHSRTSVAIGQVADVRAEFGEFTQRADLRHVGDWHSHPGDSSEPSREDMTTWKARLEKSGGDEYVGVIATRPDDGLGWRSPLLRAWVVRRDWVSPPGRYVCEPAILD